MAMSICSIDRAAIRGIRFIDAADLAKRVAEASPAIALIVSEGEIALERVRGGAPVASLFMFERDAEVQARVARGALHHAAQRFYAITAHVSLPSRRRDVE